MIDAKLADRGWSAEESAKMATGRVKFGFITTGLINGLPTDYSEVLPTYTTQTQMWCDKCERSQMAMGTVIEWASLAGIEYAACVDCVDEDDSLMWTEKAS
jgi:hypothetical protein